MPVMRFSAAPETQKSNEWRLFAEREQDALMQGIGAGSIDLGVIDPDFDMTGLPVSSGHPVDRHIKSFQERTGLGGEGPICVFVHGFQFDPRIETEKHRPGKSSNPHVQLYHFSEVQDKDGKAEPGSEEEHNSHATPWLRRATDDPDATDFPGLAVGFGYESWGNALGDTDQPKTSDLWRAMLNIDWQHGAFRNVYAQAYIDAEYAATALATVLDRLVKVLDAAGDDRPIDLFAHSLGTRTTMLALDILARRPSQTLALNRIGRVLLLAGAASWLVTSKILRNLMVARPGNPPEIFNFPSSEDAVIALLGSRAALRAAAENAGIEDSIVSRLGRLIKGGEMIGREGRPDLSAFAGPIDQYDNWVDVQLDNPATMRWGERQGFQLNGDRKSRFDIWKVLSGNFDEGIELEMLDHWVHYTAPSNWKLYRAILGRADGMTPDKIREGILAER